MAKKKPILPLLIMLGLLVAAFVVAMGYFSTPAEAFFGKCYTRAGILDQECVKQNESRIIPITYVSKAKAFRRSNSGDQRRNYINREYTQSYRADDNGGSKILNRHKARYRSFRVSYLDGLMRQKQLLRQKKAAEQEAKFEQ